MPETLNNTLKKLGACADARAWAATQPTRKAAWENCKRSEWMLWAIARSTISPDDQRLRLMACDFAEAVLHLIPAGETRPAEAVRIARLFALGEATREELATAWAAAWAAAGAAGDAAGDAAWAAWAAGTAWDAARDAAWAAGTAGDAARAAQASIIRKYYPNPPRLKAGHNVH